MFKSVIILLILSVLLIARQNPFFPSTKIHKLNITLKEVHSYIPLKVVSISLPSSARILKKVIVKFVNIDGSVGTKSINITNSVNWHIPLFISQSYNTNLQHIKQSNIKSMKIIKYIKTIKFNHLITLYIAKKSVKIKTKDINIRHFMMVDPYRIVLDFKHNSSFLTFKKRIKNSIIKVIAIGNHLGYYRVVITLDGQYSYNFKKVTDGYKIQYF